MKIWDLNLTRWMNNLKLVESPNDLVDLAAEFRQ